MLRSSAKPKDKEAGDLIFKQLSKKRAETNRPLAKGKSYEAITKTWIFDLLELRCAQSKDPSWIM